MKPTKTSQKRIRSFETTDETTKAKKIIQPHGPLQDEGTPPKLQSTTESQEGVSD